MKSRQYLYLLFTLLLAACSTPKESKQADTKTTYNEPHRPQYHFSPDSMWMNDPNGMVYHQGVYHLFYQYYPDSNVWGPMHWGHAVSKDMIRWEHKPIALYPDKLGYIFSGSAVVDAENTSGLGTRENPPLVAIYSYHDAEKEKAGDIDYQTQGIAFSLDNGDSWTKYNGNPVLPNPGIKDFRDPKVSWYPESEQWVMALAVKDHISFYSSPNLIDWNLESEFGKDRGAHGGVWECPDLLRMKVEGTNDEKWVLLVSINPGGPNGGSATQYFVGDFDGKTFTTRQTNNKWIDYGPDNYAGVTWFNTGTDIYFLGWMSNWDYAQIVPTTRWRSAMTVPRQLSLAQVNDDYLVRSTPVDQLAGIEKSVGGTELSKEIDLGKSGIENSMFKLSFNHAGSRSFEVVLSNEANERLIYGFDQDKGMYYIDRSGSGKVDFKKEFSNIAIAPAQISGSNSTTVLYVDKSSVEVFAEDGLTQLTSLYFSEDGFDQIEILDEFNEVSNISISAMEGIW